MSAAAPLVGAERRYCLITHKWYPVWAGVTFGENGSLFYSHVGYERHLEALRAFQTGELPEGCQECGSRWGGDLNADGKPTYTLSMKDGIYQILCRKCADAYDAKAKERFKDTPYAAMRKL